MVISSGDTIDEGELINFKRTSLASVDRGEGHLALEIAGEPGVTYTTRFIGTRRGFDTESKPVRDAEGTLLPGSSQIYSEAIGEVLLETTELTSAYELTRKELYVRAVVTSDKPMENPPVKGDWEMAWVQPVLAR